MKKTFAIILTFSILFLCACGAKDTKTTATTINTESTTEYVPVVLTLPTTTTMPTTEPVYFSQWPTDLIPKNFPAPPEGSYAFLVEKFDHTKSEVNFASDWVVISFTCPEQNFHTFTNGMTKLGYIGGSKKITNGTYYTNGYKGYWQDGKNIVKIDSTNTDEDGNITAIIEIAPCADNFPEPLTEFFPKFNGYTTSNGDYCGYDISKTPYTNTYDDGFPAYWYWEYRFSNGFVGVTYEEFKAYYEALGEMDFSGVITSSVVDGCDTISVDVTKVIGEDTYAVYILFNQTLRTLDIAYTNDPSLYT